MTSPASQPAMRPTINQAMMPPGSRAMMQLLSQRPGPQCPGPDPNTSAVLAANPEQPKQDDDHQGNPQQPHQQVNHLLLLSSTVPAESADGYARRPRHT